MDGELQDISDYGDNEYLYGDANSAHSAQLVGHNEIHVKHMTETGAISEVMLQVAGNGPGELWSCHWNFWVCLPAEEQAIFEESTVGLFGTPDGNTQNDWMDPTGSTLEIPHGHGANKGREAFDYCHDNWCISQEESLMIYPQGSTYDDHKCKFEEYVDFKVDQDHCVLSATKINEMCKDMPPLLVHSCHVDCCFGGCPSMKKVAETVTDIQVVVYDEDEDNIIYDPVFPDICDEENYFKESTSETACPDSPEGVVKVLHGSDDLPEDKDIIYGIEFEEYHQDENIGRTIKFRVSSPFEEGDVYLRYEKKVGLVANDPACDPIENVYCGVDEIEVGCVEFPNVEPFAVFDLYFASKEDSFILANASKDTEIEKCCHPPVDLYAEEGYKILKYSFEVKCTCPGLVAEAED